MNEDWLDAIAPPSKEVTSAKKKKNRESADRGSDAERTPDFADSDGLRLGADGEPGPAPILRPPPILDANGRAARDAGRAFDPDVHCPGCERRHGDSIAVQALRVLQAASKKFIEAKSGPTGDRAQAFEEYMDFLMENSAVLVGSRIVSLDALSKMVREVHQMIGAPKKRAEAGEEAPLDLFAAWLNN
jgi:hypothetical protein